MYMGSSQVGNTTNLLHKHLLLNKGACRACARQCCSSSKRVHIIGAVGSAQLK